MGVHKRLRNTCSDEQQSSYIQYFSSYLGEKGDIPSSVSSLTEPNDGRRRLLDLDPSGVSHEDGEESRE